MQITSQVGPVTTNTSLGAATIAPVRAGQLGDLITSELHGRYYETSYRRALFIAANQAGATLVSGLPTSYTGGLVLYNSLGSTVNLSINKVGFAASVVWSAAAVIGLAVGYNGGTALSGLTAATPRSLFVGVGATGQGLAATVATLPTAATVSHLLGSTGTLATTSEGVIPPTVIDLEGGIVLPPGAYCHFYTSATGGAAGFFGFFQYEEIPV